MVAEPGWFLSLDSMLPSVRMFKEPERGIAKEVHPGLVCHLTSFLRWTQEVAGKAEV